MVACVSGYSIYKAKVAALHGWQYRQAHTNRDHMAAKSLGFNAQFIRPLSARHMHSWQPTNQQVTRIL
jgi:hypothetical protein